MNSMKAIFGVILKKRFVKKNSSITFAGTFTGCSAAW